MKSPNIADFASAAEEFCALAEIRRAPTKTDLWKIRDLLLRLIYNVPAVEEARSRKKPPTKADMKKLRLWAGNRITLKELFPEDRQGKRPTDARTNAVRRRFNGFPFQSYNSFFDPLDIVGALAGKNKPGIALLGDDLADIYVDLSEGLDNYRHGAMKEACFNWAFGYQSHWARHAVGALHAIEIYRTDVAIPVKEHAATKHLVRSAKKLAAKRKSKQPVMTTTEP